jgi:hypothetical protein
MRPQEVQPMQFIKLMRADGNGEVYINPAAVAYVAADVGGAGTKIQFLDDRSSVYVDQPAESVVQAMEESR